jgi:hypothetical protein
MICLPQVIEQRNPVILLPNTLLKLWDQAGKRVNHFKQISPHIVTSRTNISHFPQVIAKKYVPYWSFHWRHYTLVSYHNIYELSLLYIVKKSYCAILFYKLFY